MRKTLQILIVLFGITDVCIALLHIFIGPSVIPGSVPVNATMDSEDRFYATLFLAFGITLIWCARNIETKATVIYALMATFFVGGLARLISMASVGLPGDFFVLMTGIELTLPLVLAAMMYKVAAAKR